MDEEAVSDQTSTIESLSTAQKPNRKFGLAAVVFAGLALVVTVYTLKSLFIPSGSNPSSTGGNNTEKFNLKQIESQQEYLDYLAKAKDKRNFDGAVTLSPSRAGEALEVSEKSQVGSDYSQTNLQVAGVDEADIVKTDGKTIFVSSQNRLLRPLPMDNGMPYPSPSFKMQVVGLDPFSSLTSLETSGDMYLTNDTLVVLEGNSIKGYDVNDPRSPKLLWKNILDDRVTLLSSRVIADKLYLFTRTIATTDCLTPLLSGGLSIACTDIYRPWSQTDADSVFSVLEVQLADGIINKSLSFLGTADSSTIYVSNNNAYVTYSDNLDFYSILSDFYLTDGKSLLAAGDLAKIKDLSNLSISNQAKLTEISVLVDEYKKTLSNDDLMAYESNSQNLMSTYLTRRTSEIYKTAVVQIGLSDLSLSASTVFPGYPVNQFALDEYQDTFRVAATNGSGSVNAQTDSTLYVYDLNLKLLGQVSGLGKGERIYAVRFVEDRAFVVTFQQTDPFYVIDLSNSKKPVLAGELKIPGFSSYLHLLSKNLVLGLGKEGNFVKLSLFDVTNPQVPLEVDKYTSNFYWSAALDNHKAFLQKANSQQFFIPGDSGGYVFSYATKKLNLDKAIAQPGLLRAVYVDNDWYFVSSTDVRKYANLSSETSRVVFE